MDRRFYQGKPVESAALEEARASDAVARKIYALRHEKRLSQRELAKLTGTTASVICRLKSADYEEHSLAMPQRIAAALDRRVEIRFVPIGRHVAARYQRLTPEALFTPVQSSFCLLANSSVLCSAGQTLRCWDPAKDRAIAGVPRASPDRATCCFPVTA